MHITTTAQVVVSDVAHGIVMVDLSTTTSRDVPEDAARLAAETAPLLRNTSHRLVAAIGPALGVDQQDTTAASDEERVYVSWADLMEVAARVLNGWHELHEATPAPTEEQEAVAVQGALAAWWLQGADDAGAEL